MDVTNITWSTNSKSFSVYSPVETGIVNVTAGNFTPGFMASVSLNGTPLTNVVVGSEGSISFAFTNVISNVLAFSIYQPALTAFAGVVKGADGSVTLNATGFPGYTWLLQTTTNLAPPVVWQTIGTNAAAANGSWQFTDAHATNSAGFYRAALVPYTP
jgi:hypothetical protein